MSTKQLLFIPGPVPVAPAVLAAMARPMINHRGTEFAELLGSISKRIAKIFGTKGDVVINGCSGSGGLEAAVVNAFSPGEAVLACPIGVFGNRIADIARNYGCQVEVLETVWGSALDPAALAARLAADTGHTIKGILLTHNETSTGVQNNMAAIAKAIGSHPATVIVDSVSGLAASDFRMDEWNFDIVVSASQKALAAPPGLAMIAVSARGWERIEQAKIPRFYMDLQKARTFAKDGQTPWTPPISIMQALDVAIDLYEAEEPAQVWERHARYASAIRAAIKALGLELLSAEGAHSPTVVAFKVPSSVDAGAVLKSMRERANVVLSGGQGALKGKIWRMGTMGDVSQTDVLAALGSLEVALLENGFHVPVGAGVRTALEIFLSPNATLGGARTTAAEKVLQTTAVST